MEEFFFGSALHSRGREDCVWCRARWSALSEVAALDAPSLGMLWKHNGSWLRVQARLSRIYIYIKAANPPELHCSRGETHSELLCSRLHDQTLVSLRLMLLFALKCSQQDAVEIFGGLISSQDVVFALLKMSKRCSALVRLGFYWSQRCINGFLTLHHISQKKHIMRILNIALNHSQFHLSYCVL